MVGPIVPPSDPLQPETTQFQCPECGKGCFLGIRASGGTVFTCHEHGSFHAVSSKGRVNEGAAPPAVALPADRHHLVESACRVFLGKRVEEDFLILQSSSLPCNYVMARVLGHRIRLEVCSREWGCQNCGDRPLSTAAHKQLTAMGFTMPGPRENLERWVEPSSPTELSNALERSLVVAYADPHDTDLIIYFAQTADVGSLVETLSWPMRAQKPGPGRSPEVRLGRHFQTALLLAATLHRNQTRRGTNIPYIAHLLSVAAIVLEAGGDEELACAALLHDAIEDQGGKETEAAIARLLTPRVSAIVLGCSDTDVVPKPPWLERKRRYLWHLENEADKDVLLVSLADKLHNLSCTVNDRRAEGAEVWAKFNAGSDEQLSYYSALADLYGRKRPGPLAESLRTLLNELLRLEGDPEVIAFTPLLPDIDDEQ